MALLVGVAAQTCNIYYVFVPDSGEDTCFYRVEQRCATSYDTPKDSETYAWSSSFSQGAYLSNKTDNSSPSLSDACKHDFSQKLFLSVLPDEPTIGFFWYFMPPLDSTPYQGTPPYVLVDGVWYQGLKVSVQFIGDDKSGVVILALDVEHSVVKLNAQPSNTRPADAVARWNTTYTLIAVGAGAAFLIILILIVQVCRHKDHDLHAIRKHERF